MTTYVALLRGIGPGNPAMRNDRLRSVFDELGFDRVRSVISSGNVLFESRARSIPRLEARIEAAWPERLGFTSTTIIRTRTEIEAMVAADPFAGREDTKAASQQVTFLKREPHRPLPPFRSDRGDYEVVAVRDRAVFSIVDETGTPPGLLRRLEKELGKEMTTRSWKTVHRIAGAMDIT